MTPEHYLAVRSDGLSFLACVQAAADDLELLAQVDRLYGTNLLCRQSPIANMIDHATGKADADKPAIRLGLCLHKVRADFASQPMIHTPGPWYVIRRSATEKRLLVSAKNDGDRILARCDEGYISRRGEIPHAEREANAALIADAPDILAALVELVVAAEAGGLASPSLERAKALVQKHLTPTQPQPNPAT